MVYAAWMVIFIHLFRQGRIISGSLCERDHLWTGTEVSSRFKFVVWYIAREDSC